MKKTTMPQARSSLRVPGSAAGAGPAVVTAFAPAELPAAPDRGLRAAGSRRLHQTEARI